MGKINTAFFRRKTGFTLTEVLIVVLIIGILASISLPQLTKTIEKAKVGEAISNLNLIRVAEKVYFLKNREFTNQIGLLNVEVPADNTTYFNYSISTTTPPSVNFTATAQRNGGPNPYNGYWYRISKAGIITSDGTLI